MWRHICYWMKPPELPIMGGQKQYLWVLKVGLGGGAVKELVTIFNFSEYFQISKGLVFRVGPLHPWSRVNVDGREHLHHLRNASSEKGDRGGRDMRSLCAHCRLRVALQSRVRGQESGVRLRICIRFASMRRGFVCSQSNQLFFNTAYEGGKPRSRHPEMCL